MSRNTLRELICSHTKTYIVPSGGNFWKHEWKLFTAPSFRSYPNTKKPCHLYLHHQNPHTAPALCHRCLAASERLLHFKESKWSPRDKAWEHANKFPIIHRKGDKRVQPRPPWEGNRRKASFNTTPRITRCCSVYHRSGLATKCFGQTTSETRQFLRWFLPGAGEGGRGDADRPRWKVPGVPPCVSGLDPWRLCTMEDFT